MTALCPSVTNANPGNNWHENCTSQLDCCWNCTSAPTLAQLTSLSVTKTPNRHKWIQTWLWKCHFPASKSQPTGFRSAQHVDASTSKCVFLESDMIWFFSKSSFLIFDKRSYSDYNKYMKHNFKCSRHVYQHVQTSGMDSFLWILVVLWILICFCVACTTLLLPLFFQC